MCAGPKQSMAPARNHSPQQVCVAETYTDVKGKGEETWTDSATTEQALRCLKVCCDQHAGVGEWE